MHDIADDAIAYNAITQRGIADRTSYLLCQERARSRAIGAKTVRVRIVWSESDQQLVSSGSTRRSERCRWVNRCESEFPRGR